MFDTCIIRKIGLFGIGITVLTQEKLEEFTQEMIKKGEIKTEEGEKFAKEVLLERDILLKEIDDKINQQIKDLIETSGIVTKKDIEHLENRIEELKKTIEEMKEK